MNNSFKNRASVYERLSIIKISALPFPWLQTPFNLITKDTEHPEGCELWSFCFSKSMSIANALSMLLLLKRHERSECHSLWFCLWFSFYSFKKLLKAFSPPSSPCVARLSDFKKLQMAWIKLQMAWFWHLKNYKWHDLKLQMAWIKLQ